jgi:hypothetical protein
LTQHVRQAAEAYWTCDERPWYFVIVIQVFVKTLNFCIIKTPESPVPAETYAKSRVFQGLRKQGSSDAIWGQTGHPNEVNLSEAARLGDHFLSERPEKCVPMAGG